MTLLVVLATLLAVGSTAKSAGLPSVVVLGPEGGDVRSLAVHADRPNSFFLGTADGQIRVSRNSGDSWKQLTPGLNRRNLVVDNLVFDPQDADTLYAATWELKSDKGWLFRTRDGGESWHEVHLGRYSSAIRAAAVAPSDPRVVALGITEGVIISQDEGNTWDRITRGYRSLYHVESLAFDPVDAQTLYVGTWHLGWKTLDSGQSWKPIHKGMLFDSDMFSLLVDTTDPEVLYSSACTGIYKSVNGGLRWTHLKRGLPKKAKRTRTLHLDPSSPGTIYAGTTAGLFRSTDAGAHWRPLVSNVVVNTIAVNPQNSRIILVGTDDAGILKSQDGGATFQPSNRGFVYRQVPVIAAAPSDPGIYYVSVVSDGSHGGFFVSRNGGFRWKSHNEGLGTAGADIRVILPASLGQSVYLGTSRGVFRGQPGREPWQNIEATSELTVLDLTFSDKDERGLFLATTEGFFLWALGDETLHELVLPLYQGSVNTVFYDRPTGHLLVGTEVGLFRSRNEGRTWEIKVDGLPSSSIHILRKAGRRFFCGTRAGLFFSENHGETWSRCGDVYPIDINTLQTNPLVQEQIVAASSLTGHLFYSWDGGDNWSVMNLGSNRSAIASFAFGRFGDVLAGTLSEGVYKIQSFQSAFSESP